MSFKGKDVGNDKRTGFQFRGKEILLSKTRGRPVTGLVKMGMDRGIFPQDKQIEAATIYAATGSLDLASERAGVPAKIIKKWASEPWFTGILVEFRNENLAKLDAAFTEIIDRAAVELKDRLIHGDYIVTKYGELRRKPVSLRDLALAQAINIDKRQLLRGEPTSRSETTSQEKSNALLENLANKFLEMTELRRLPQTYDVSDAEIVEEKESAKQVEETSSPDGGGSPQQVVRKEGGD